MVRSSGLAAQETPADHSAVNRAGEVTGERDKDKEDQVAKLFEAVRSNLHSSKLARIERRNSLEEQVCTLALTGTLPAPARLLTDTVAFYRTGRPDAISPELEHVASFDALRPKNKAGYRRFSVAVWRNRDPKTRETMYWVAIELYWSAPVEFFDYHFTDDISYHNEWKRWVAPECRGK